MPFILFRILSRRYASFRKRVRIAADNALENVFRGGMMYLIMITLVWIAIFLYVVFYYAYVPALSYSRPIHLQIPSYGSKHENLGFPSAYVRLTKRNHLLMMGQPYKFTIKLELPESPANKELGMFMVCIQLKDKRGYLTSQSCRSNMLHYRSNLVHIAKLIVFSPLFIFGAKEEKQTLYFELYNDFEEDQYHPVTDIYVEVRAPNIEVYSATLYINAVLSGLRYFMFYWPISSAIVGIIVNLFFVFFTTSLSFYNNFFIDTAPVKIFTSQFKKLEAEGSRLLEGTSARLGLEIASPSEGNEESESQQATTSLNLTAIKKEEESSSSSTTSSDLPFLDINTEFSDGEDRDSSEEPVILARE